VTYEAQGFGVGELYLRGDVLVWHELPVAGRAGGGARHPVADLLERHFRGEDVDFTGVALDLEELGPFHRDLLAALRAVPRGHVVSYGELAALAGRPRAARAAGTFCARNRFPIVVPCHRVVSADGIGSFGVLGLDCKLRLLALEGWRPSESSPGR
jgi:methylated-DNA-[protein]-cysteine S-methyltransferase